VLKEIELDLSSYQFVIINPGIHISTASAFSQITPGKPAHAVADIISLPVTQWKELLVNDFERTVSQIHPQIAAIKQELYHKGAAYASMTGSGSTVFGLFEKENRPALTLHADWKAYYI
jgi:4-diphosphocytidyl-2-C-methyl-D-erythritol kinase